MATRPLSAAERARLARRPKRNDLDRLSAQFRSQAEQLTTEFQGEFGKYQADVQKRMEPYQAAAEQYQTEALPAFESAMQAYRQRYDTYLQALNSYQPYLTENATRTLNESFIELAPYQVMVQPGRTELVPSYETVYNIGSPYFGNSYNPYSSSPFVGGYGGGYSYTPPPQPTTVVTYNSVYIPPVYETIQPDPIPVYTNTFTLGGQTYSEAEFAQYLESKQGFIDTENGMNLGLVVKNPVAAPTFNEQAPTAPDIPLAPEIPAFDDSEMQARRKALEQGFNREIGERTSSRLNAVRRSRRSLLSNVT